jgi:Sortase domain
MDISTRHRRALSTALALFLAVESVSAVAAVAHVSTAARDAGTRHALPAAAAAGSVLADDATPEPQRPASLPAAAILPATAPIADPTSIQAPVAPPASVPAPARAPRVAASTIKAPKGSSKSSGTSRATGSPKATSFKGRNHVWIPTLGINRSVASFPCSRSAPPNNYVYRWGCAGRNNVYLLGHAYSVFKPLHDAYVGHRLHVGMKAYYADGSGRTHVYRVKWWKLTLPTTSASWAWAAQSVPSMTLQTCVGRNSQYRLMVRLVEVR